MGIFPLPNNAADPTGRLTGANWISTPLQPVDTRQDLIRGDVAITDSMNLMVRYINETWVHGEAAGNFWGDTPFPTLSSDWEQPSRSFAVKLTNTLSSTAVNEFQFSRAGNDIFVTTSEAGQATQLRGCSRLPDRLPARGRHRSSDCRLGSWRLWKSVAPGAVEQSPGSFHLEG